MCLFFPPECLKALGHLEVAAKSYSKVVEMASLHLEARLALSTLQQQLGRPDSALEALEPMYDPDTLARDSSAAQQVSVVAQLVVQISFISSQLALDMHIGSHLA